MIYYAVFAAELIYLCPAVDVSGFSGCFPTSGGPGNDEPYRLAASASQQVHRISHRPNRAPSAPHLQLGYLSTLVQVLLLAVSLLRHSLEVSAVQELRCFTVSGLTVHLPT